MRSRLLVVVVLALLCGMAWAIKENLPADAQIRIGVKFRPEKCERKAQDGDRVKVHYTGKLYTNDVEFDTSRTRRQPFAVTLGKGQVIKGWEIGLLGMCVGEIRKLVIPSGLGYGSSEMGKIPADSTLVFDVEMIGIDEREGEL